MTPFFIFVATVCFTAVDDYILWVGYDYALRKGATEYIVSKNDNKIFCLSSIVRTSTSPIARESETGYRVIPAIQTKCDFFGHNWDSRFDPCTEKSDSGVYWTVYPCLWDERCKICGRKRRKITEERWEEEQQ